jgi:hypothetical protein
VPRRHRPSAPSDNATAGTGEDQVLSIRAGWELATDGGHDLRGEGELADAGVALGSRLEAVAEAAGLVADVNHLEHRWGAVQVDAAPSQPG